MCGVKVGGGRVGWWKGGGRRVTRRSSARFNINLLKFSTNFRQPGFTLRALSVGKQLSGYVYFGGRFGKGEGGR